MCEIVYFEGGKTARNVGELRAAIGAENVVYFDDPCIGEECLCGVAVRSSAERAGYECCERGMDFEFVKKPESEARDGEA